MCYVDDDEYHNDDWDDPDANREVPEDEYYWDSDDWDCMNPDDSDMEELDGFE